MKLTDLAAAQNFLSLCDASSMSCPSAVDVRKRRGSELVNTSEKISQRLLIGGPGKYPFGAFGSHEKPLLVDRPQSRTQPGVEFAEFTDQILLDRRT